MSAHPITALRPSALGSDLHRFASLTYTLAVTEFKLRFFGSALGYVWTLMRPLLFFGVLYAVFSQVLKFGGDVKYYPVYLLTGIVFFTFFAEVTGGCLVSLVTRENLLRKIRFPRLVIPLSVALTSLFNLGMNLLAVLIFALASGVRPRLSWLVVPLLVLLLAAFATGIGMLLSALYVRFRDIDPIWDVIQQAILYGSPILYVAAEYPPSVLEPALCNPLASILTEMRHSFLDPNAPTAATAIGMDVRLLIPFAIVVGVFALGFWVFNREAPRIAEHL